PSPSGVPRTAHVPALETSSTDGSTPACRGPTPTYSTGASPTPGTSTVGSENTMAGATSPPAPARRAAPPTPSAPRHAAITHARATTSFDPALMHPLPRAATAATTDDDASRRQKSPGWLQDQGVVNVPSLVVWLPLASMASTSKG